MATEHTAKVRVLRLKHQVADSAYQACVSQIAAAEARGVAPSADDAR